MKTVRCFETFGAHLPNHTVLHDTAARTSSITGHLVDSLVRTKVYVKQYFCILDKYADQPKIKCPRLS